MNTVLMVLVMIVSLAPLPAREIYHRPIARNDENLLVVEMRYVDIPVLANDFGPGQDSLRVVAVTTVQGGKAEIIDGATVRVYIDWSGYYGWPGSGGGSLGKVAHGAYIVSNGYARSRGTWTVWYMPDMRV